jgi:uncharacterized protein (DUF2236 family)
VNRTTDYPARSRLFSPDCELWRVDREMALLMAGGRALLMQLAHPMIAAGVAQHSDFANDAIGRLQRTMSAMWSIGFEERSKAEAALQRVNRLHQGVRGVVPANELKLGARAYFALDQQLLLWVHATLIDSALVGYQAFVGPLSRAAMCRYYDDSKRLAELFKIRPEMVPGCLLDFESYMRRMLTGDAISVGPTALRLARDILYPRPLLFRPGGPLFRLVTAGLLPDDLRRGYGLAWNDARERRLRLFGRIVRGFLPRLPAQLRIVPQARRAERESRRAPG